MERRERERRTNHRLETMRLTPLVRVMFAASILLIVSGALMGAAAGSLSRSHGPRAAPSASHAFPQVVASTVPEPQAPRRQAQVRAWRPRALAVVMAVSVSASGGARSVQTLPSHWGATHLTI